MNLYVGKNLEEALDKAADAENVDVEYLQYRIVRDSENEVEIEAYFVADVIDYVKGYLNTVLTNMGLKVELTAKYEGEVINVNIKTDHDAVLIGKGGRTLQALNELVRVAIHNRYNKHYKILLDIGEYKEEKYEKLIQMARRYAKEVQQTKTKVTLRPMPSDERRIIHGALTSYHNIKTESVGQGKDRRLTIYYVEE
jgi:spoIIIJ-associated protein